MSSSNLVRIDAVSLPVETVEQLEEEAEKKGLPLRTYIRVVIVEALRENVAGEDGDG